MNNKGVLGFPIVALGSLLLIALVLITFTIVFLAIINLNEVELKISSEYIYDSTPLMNLLKLKNEQGKTTLELIRENYKTNGLVSNELKKHLEKSIELIPTKEETYVLYAFYTETKEQLENFPTDDEYQYEYPLSEQSILIPISKDNNIIFTLLVVE